ncbi:MAG: Holliday junction resolvase RuvX [Caldilineaceae bacterium]|nr:Holliday junction resolvase RuvX [Caldilineaceae bacterium]
MTQPTPLGNSKPPGKIIALDVGDARIGVAACDPLRLTVRPLHTLQRRNRRADFDALAKICAEEEAVLIVCGLPCNMDGSEGPQARKVRNWAARFTRALRNIRGAEVPLVFWDERLSSFAADQWIAAEGSHPAGQDAVAAAVILRSYLDVKRSGQ